MEYTVAVVILNWNGRAHLATYLPSVVEHSKNATVYVADNCSTDDSVAFVKANFPAVSIIQNKENGGFALGYNQALANLKEDYFILLNSDVEVTANWIEPVVDFMAKNENVAIAQPKIKSHSNKKMFEYAGAAGGYIDFLGYPFCKGRIFSYIEEDVGQYDEKAEVFWATGAAMFVKSEVFHKLEGFDVRYFAHMEEIDLCWRAKNLGYQVYYIPESTVYHLGGGTMQNSNPRKTFLNFRNSLLTLHKNDYSGFRNFKVVLRLFMDLPAFFKLLFENGFKHAIAVPQAHLSFYKMEKTKSMVNKPNLNGLYMKSIVSAFFLNGFKKFSDLLPQDFLKRK